jgi:hypothetical protein
LNPKTNLDIDQEQDNTQPWQIGDQK